MTVRQAKPTLPVPLTMDASYLVPKQSPGKTFVVAISVLGIVALAQLVAIGWAFMQRFQSAPIPQRAPAAAQSAPAAAEARDQLDTRDTFAADETEYAPLPKPTPIPRSLAIQEPLAEPAAAGRLREALAQARALRDRGDTSTALVRLREAERISPDSAMVISEMAITFEKMGLTDKAAEQWRRIYEMGESAGIYYAAAEAKLAATTPDATAAPSPAGPAEAIQPGSVLGIVSVQKEEVEDTTVQRRFNLVIPLRARQNPAVDVREVVIQVYFYDQLEDESIVQTAADVNSRWTTLPADWSGDDIEVLQVEYAQPNPDAAQVKAGDTRKFYGYVIRAYYKGELQDMRAEPVTLLKQFPPPLTLENE